MAAAAHLKLLVRQPDTVGVLAGLPDLQQAPCSNIPARAAAASPDGAKLAAVTDASVDIHDLATGAKLAGLAVAGVVFMDWSRTGAFITTAQRASKGGDGQPAKNIKVWDVSSGAVVLELGAKSVNKEVWPLLHWGAGDEAAYHAVTNTVHRYARADGFKGAKKIPVKGVTSFMPCPAPGKQLLAAFAAEAKGQPAVATVLDCAGAEPVAVSRKSFYRATGASILWNAPSTAALFMATCETDATNQSYYGESKLHYLPAEPGRADEACAVAMPKDGPVHDVQWSPAGDFFVVVAGFMPAKVILHDNRCKPVYDLGSGPYSTARWNPFGRFLAIAGFGNLPGDIVFYNKMAKGNCKQMGATRSGSAVTAAWSPCGRYLMTATTAPRLRVDNNVRVFDYCGNKVCERPFDTLLEAAWLPAAPGEAHEDRPPSPERVSAAGKAGGGGAAGGAAGGAGGGAAASKPAYRPPAMRTLQAHLAAGAAAINVGGAGGPTFSLAYDSSSKPGRIATQAGGKPLPPGAEFVSKAASKNAKKRANKKSKAGGGGDGDEDGEPEQQQQQPKQPQQPGVAAVTEQMAAAHVGGAAAAGAGAAAAGGGGAAADPADAAQKRVRALQKKLRQIQQLKERRDAEGAGALEPEQLQKIEAEASVIAEIQELGGTA